jgi:IS1 family transposase
MNKLSTEKRAQIIGMLVEGNSLRSVSRMADVSINTVTKLLVDVGQACSEYQHKTLVNLPCTKIQVDEIWAFCYAKQKNVEKAKAAPEVAGDIWTWTAICADTKLIPSWLIGDRTLDSATLFIDDLRSRLSNRIQLTSDGLKAYVKAVDDAFGSNIDYAILHKIYGNTVEGQKRYSPAACVGIDKKNMSGNPDSQFVSTSYVERQNLTMRMGMRRFTRLTNAFSKKAENHGHAVALHFMHYNFARIHKTLKVSPAMAAGVTNKLWSYEHIVRLIKD